MTSTRTSRRAFTLIEALLVGALLSAVVWIALGRGRDAQVTRAEAHVSQLRRVAERHLATTGRCPTMGELVGRAEVPAAEIDPWGKEYWFACRDGSVTVLSDGRDRRPFTSDDVSDPVAWSPARTTALPAWRKPS